MMQPLISIIMPVYNTGDILLDTVNSIINQTFKNYELIMIDDGSDKKTAELCDYFSHEDERIIVIHKKNEGACAARNLGITKARGKYLTFCDHDDTYETGLLEKEIQLINMKKGFDMAIVGALHILDDGEKIKYGSDIELSNKDKIEENTAKVMKSGILVTVWNVLYRKDLIGGTRFNENLKKGHEDIIFNIEIYQKANSLIATKECLYNHFIRKSMSTSATYHQEAVEALKIANNQIYKMCLNVYKKINRLDYINLQGEYIKTYSTYLVHLKYNYKEFRNNIKKLDYISEKYRLKELIVHRNKDALCFYCLTNKKILLLYLCIIFNKFIKGN